MLNCDHPLFATSTECKLVEFLNALLQECGGWEGVTVASVDAVLIPEGNKLNFQVNWVEPEGAVTHGDAVLAVWHCPERGWLANFED